MMLSPTMPHEKGGMPQPDRYGYYAIDAEEFIGALRWSILWAEAFPPHLSSHFCRNGCGYGPVDGRCDAIFRDVCRLRAYRSFFDGREDGGDADAYGVAPKSLPNTLGDKLSRNYLISAGGVSDADLGYGEILPSTVFDVLDEIERDHGGINSVEGTRAAVVDLGSGSGRPLFACALGFPFDSATGYEIVPQLHAEARRAAEEWVDRSGVAVEESAPPLAGGESSPPFGPCRFRFVCADLRASGDVVAGASLVLVHASLYGPCLMAAVHGLCRRCVPGTFFVMVTRPLQGPAFETLTESRRGMSWGTADVFIQRRTAVPWHEVGR